MRQLDFEGQNSVGKKRRKRMVCWLRGTVSPCQRTSYNVFSEGTECADDQSVPQACANTGIPRRRVSTQGVTCSTSP